MLQVAQTLGGVLGATAALRVIPQAWRGKFSNYAHGVVPGTMHPPPEACNLGFMQGLQRTLTGAGAGSSILEGALTEAALAFALNIVILWSISESESLSRQRSMRCRSACR